MRESLPTFRKVMRPVLRDAEGGAETTVWLAAVQPAPAGGGVWHDRAERPTHLPTTRTGPNEAAAMGARVREQAGLT